MVLGRIYTSKTLKGLTRQYLLQSFESI